MITPGSILLPNVLVPKGEIWGGIPACKIRDVTEEDRIRVTREWRELAEQSKSFIKDNRALAKRIESSNSSNSSNSSDSSDVLDTLELIYCYNADKWFPPAPADSASDFDGDGGDGDFGGD